MWGNLKHIFIIPTDPTTLNVGFISELEPCGEHDVPGCVAVLPAGRPDVVTMRLHAPPVPVIHGLFMPHPGCTGPSQQAQHRQNCML